MFRINLPTTKALPKSNIISKIKEVEDLIEKYDIDISLGSNDLYIGLDKESGLWLETYI